MEVPMIRNNKKGRWGRCFNCCNDPQNMENDGEGQDGSTPVINRANQVSYLQDLPGPLVPGTCITVTGLIKPRCPRFSVNLCCGRDDDCDIALHVNPRFTLGCIVRNSLIKGNWGEEEDTSVQGLNLERRKIFFIDVFVAENVFYISTNGKHHSAYVFRIPIARVNTLKVVGNVEVFEVRYRKLESYPIRRPENALFEVPTVLDETVSPQEIDGTLNAIFPEGFQQDWQLEIYGRVRQLPATFFINLQKGITLWPRPVIHFHLNPRFSTVYGTDILVSNAWVDDRGWGPEERCPGFKFRPGRPFVLAIRRLDKHFSVWIDGSLVAEFRFRCPIDVIDSLVIQGDVLVKGVYMRKKIDDVCFQDSTRKTMGVEFPVSPYQVVLNYD